MNKFVITIGRSYGSGGRTLGKMLAEELGVKYYDRELLRLASDASGINESLFGQVDEKIKNSSLFRILSKVCLSVNTVEDDPTIVFIRDLVLFLWDNWSTNIGLVWSILLPIPSCPLVFFPVTYKVTIYYYAP